jgi:hypothetical protein
MKNWMDLYHQGGIIHSQTGKFDIVQRVCAGLLQFFPTGEQWAYEVLLPGDLNVVVIWLFDVWCFQIHCV